MTCVRWCARRPLYASLWAAVLLLAVGALGLASEHNRSALERTLAEAERLLALAATQRDDQDRQGVHGAGSLPAAGGRRE